MRNCNLLQMGFFARFRTVLGLAKIFFCRVCKKPQRWGFPQGLRKQKQETTCFHAVVSFAKEETETGNTYGSGRPARPVEAKILQRHPQKKFRRCSASESVFAGILMCHECHDGCGVCWKDKQLDHCEDKQFHRFTSTLYSSSFSSLSSALSIPTSNCSSTFSG